MFLGNAANKEKYSSINRIAVAKRACFEEDNRPSPHIPPYLFLLREGNNDVRDNTENTIFVMFYFALCYLMLNASKAIRFYGS